MRSRALLRLRFTSHDAEIDVGDSTSISMVFPVKCKV